ncbi:MAG TPA: dTDP-4-dehydrorhamnose 3,5-epimerase [Polyangia bacterium]|nr:dTDP-4-dehydrorhamnose 3,5-epimerase [Polyangia bacterium]
MKVTPTSLDGVLLVEPKVLGDARGAFVELYHAERFRQAGIADAFVQDNFSRSSRGVLRGLHFQEPNGQGKLLQVLRGAIFDVAVDVRRGSPQFGRWFGVELSEREVRQMWIPAGFAHGFCVTSDVAEVLYKCTAFYTPESERCIAWNDPAIGIQWPIAAPTLSARDAAAPKLADAPRLPSFK